jgi:hypothetical protein
MRKAFQTKRRQTIDEKWLQVMHPNFEGVQGEVLVSFELLTQGTVPSKFHSVLSSLLMQRIQKNFPTDWEEKVQTSILSSKNLFAQA